MNDFKRQAAFSSSRPGLLVILAGAGPTLTRPNGGPAGQADTHLPYDKGRGETDLVSEMTHSRSVDNFSRVEVYRNAQSC
jgi:hypothetical protein